MTPLYRYEGFYYLDDDGSPCWVALLGGGEFTRWQLEEMDPSQNSPEQMAEIKKALVELPMDDVLPKRGQRKRPKVAAGDIEE